MQKPILTIVVTSLILASGIVFFWWPKYQDFNDTRILLSAKKTELQNKENYFSQLENISKQLKEYSSETAKIESALPSKPGIPDILNFIGKTSSQSGLILQKTNLEKASFDEETKIWRSSLSFSLAGSYSGFKNFLSELQKSSRLIAVEEISFSSPAEEGLLSFDFRIRTNSY